MKRILVFLMLVCPVTVLSQGRPSESVQSRSIQGEVKLADGSNAGIGLYVALESDASGGFLSTQTDSRGKFTFSSLANVRYRVRVRAPGYEEEVQETDLSTMPVAFLKFHLKAKPGSTPPPQPISGITQSPSFPDDMSEDARKEFQEGYDIFSSGKNQQKSIGHFKKSADKYPKYAPTYYYLGAAQAIDKNLDDAVASLKKSLELNDKSPEALIALGSIYNSKKQFTEAEYLLTKAVELAPESFDAHKELAKSVMPNLQRTPEAEQHLKKAVALNKDSVEAHILLGNMFLRERNNEGALAEYREAVRLDPKGPMADPTRQMIAKLETAVKAGK